MATAGPSCMSPGRIRPVSSSWPSRRRASHFANTVTEAQYIENSHYLNGSGVALGDVDGDGLVDIYFASMDGPNALYRNLGDWKFEDIAAQAGVAAADRFSTGAVFADVDGDGDLDLLVNALGGRTRCISTTAPETSPTSPRTQG